MFLGKLSDYFRVTSMFQWESQRSRIDSRFLSSKSIDIEWLILTIPSTFGSTLTVSIFTFHFHFHFLNLHLIFLQVDLLERIDRVEIDIAISTVSFVINRMNQCIHLFIAYTPFPTDERELTDQHFIFLKFLLTLFGDLHLVLSWFYYFLHLINSNY